MHDGSRSERRFGAPTGQYAKWRCGLIVGRTHVGGDLAGPCGDVLTRLVEPVDPVQKQAEGADLQCLAARLPIRQGNIAIGHSLALERERLAVLASGEVDLGSDTLVMAFHPTVKQGLGMGAMDLARLVKLRGTLSQPATAADLRGAARKAASIGVAVAAGCRGAASACARRSVTRTPASPHGRCQAGRRVRGGPGRGEAGRQDGRPGDVRSDGAVLRPTRKRRLARRNALAQWR